jgi:hypothetical protein
MLKKLTFLVVLGALVLSACAARAAAPEADYATGYGGADGASVVGALPPSDEAQEQPAGVTDATVSQAVERLVIKNASLALVVKDPLASVNSITALAEELGGFVVSSNTYQASTDAEGNKIMQAYVTIRVPVEKLSEALGQLKGMAVEVRSENVSGEDVTAQYTDLESQLTNLEAAEAQLQKIMEGATRTEDVLNVYNQLVVVRGQIEQIKGQMKYYRDSAAMSAISLELIPDALAQPLQVAGWKPEGVAKEAFEALVRAFQGLATAGIWAAIYLLPLALVFGLPLYVIGRWVVRKLSKPKKQAAAA